MRGTFLILAASVLLAALVPSPAPAMAADPPRFPGPPTVTELAVTSALLTWQPPNTDPAPTYYDIYRIDNGQEWVVNSSYTTSLRLAALSPGTTYTYFVRVRPNATHGGITSPSVTFSTPAAPVESNPPTTPGTPKVTELESDRLTLTWVPSTDDSGVDRYLVYRIRFDGVVEQYSLTVVYPGNPGTTWTDWRTLPDYAYAFHIVAVDYAGNRSAESGRVDVRTPPHPGSSCRAGTQVRSTMNGRYAAVLTIVNTGVSVGVHTISGKLPPGQHNDPTRSWEFVEVDNELLFAYSGWDGGFRTGEQKQFSLVIQYEGSPVPPTEWRLNGQPCTPL